MSCDPNAIRRLHAGCPVPDGNCSAYFFANTHQGMIPASFTHSFFGSSAEKNVPGQPKRTRDVFHLPIACQRRSFDAIGFYAVGDEVIFLDFAVCQHNGREDK